MRLPEFKIELVPQSKEAVAAKGFAYADPHVGNRSKIGGAPEYLQEPCNPQCPICSEDMTFFAQLDSIGDDICLADVGLLYTFICFDCFEATSIIQSS